MTEQRTKPSLPTLDVSLDLFSPSADLDEALALLTACPSKAALDVYTHGQILIGDLETEKQTLFPTREKNEKHIQVKFFHKRS